MKINWARIGVLLGTLPISFAATLVNQPSTWTGNGTAIGFSYTSDATSGINGIRFFDDFQLSSPSAITSATWRGMFLNGSVTADGAVNATSWELNFYTDLNGSPNNFLGGQILPAASVTQTTLGTGTYGSFQATLYEFSANLTTFNAAGGTRYWFSAMAHTPDFSSFFLWSEGTGGNGTSARFQLPELQNTAQFFNNDRAFTLSDSTGPSSGVPEPASALLTVSGVAAIELLRRTRR